MSKKKPQCQNCAKENLQSVAHLGYLPAVNTLQKQGEPLEPLQSFSAHMMMCPHCYLVQLEDAPDSALIFPPEYAYRSGTTKILRTNFAELAQKLKNRFALGNGSKMIDIGSNDGTLLSYFTPLGVEVLGVEPTNIADIAVTNGIRTKKAFFGKETAAEVLKEFGPVDLITATNVFAHIPDPKVITQSIGSLLKKTKGIFISESHYLLDLVKTLQYDTIYHEHLRYYSLHALQNILATEGFEIFHVERIPTHGGSIRVYSAMKGAYPIEPSVATLLKEEVDAGLNTADWILPFRKRIAESKYALLHLIDDLLKQGKKIAAVSAPSRATTLVHYLGLDASAVQCIYEVPGSKKIGRYMPGTLIPIVEEPASLENIPYDSLLLLSWHIADELIPSLQRKGFKGNFIIPLPEPRIVDRP